MAIIPPTVSDDGTVWNFHHAGCDPVPFGVTDSGVAADISGHDVRFVVLDHEGTILINSALIADPNNSKGLRIALSTSDIALIPPRGGDFYIEDITTSGSPLLEGKVYRR